MRKQTGSYQSFSHPEMRFTSSLLPRISSIFCGLYFSVHSCDICSGDALQFRDEIKESSSVANMQTMTYAISSFCFPFSFPVDVEAIVIGGISISLASELLSKSKNPSSSKILVPSFSAFSVLDGPASRPFRKYDVLPLTPVVTRLC